MDKNDYASAPALEAAISSPGQLASRLIRVRRLLESATVLALATGKSRSLGFDNDDETPRLLTFKVEGDSLVYVPLFTNIKLTMTAFDRHPEWRTNALVEVTGAELLIHLPLPITLAINPWTDVECLLQIFSKAN